LAVTTVKITLDGTTYDAAYNAGTEKWELSIPAPPLSSYLQPSHYYAVQISAKNDSGEGGQAGGNPRPGTILDGLGGQGGKSGRVWTSLSTINAGQMFNVGIGQGGGGAGGTPPNNTGNKGVIGAYGAPTVFGAYNSDNGTEYDGMVDIPTGNVYAKNGGPGADGSPSVSAGAPGVPGTGNGGTGGDGGKSAISYIDSNSHVIFVSVAVPGSAGGAGGSGCVIISYDLQGV
jgi:hypothetical protein